MLRSGIFGTVAPLDDETLELELAPGTTIKVARQAVVKVLDGPTSDGETTTSTRTSRRGTATTRRRRAPVRSTDRQQPTGDAPADEERVAVASKTARPGRRLIVFGLGRGRAVRRRGAERRVEAQAGPRPAGRHADHARGTHRQRPEARPRPSLEEARGIIDQRVNGTGVAEAEVSTQGGRTSSSRSPARTARQPRRHGEADRPAALPARRAGRRRASRSRRRARRPAGGRAAERRPRRPARLQPVERPGHRAEAVADRHAEGPPAVRRCARRQGQAVGHARQGRRRDAEPVRAADRRALRRPTARHGRPRRRPGRPAAEVDGQPRHRSGSRSSPQFTCPTGNKAPPRSTTTRRSRWSPATPGRQQAAAVLGR